MERVKNMSEFTLHDDARRSRILEAALNEFSEKGYKKASTNTIVREAQVSKGLLFHYFISKKELYIYICNAATDTITEELMEEVNFADRDVLNRLHQSTFTKIESYNKHPKFVKLFESVEQVEDAEIVERVTSKSLEVSNATFEAIFKNIDYYQFKDRLNVDRCLDVVKWTIDKIGFDWKQKYKGITTNENYEELKMDITNYLDLFRDAFYR